VRRPLAGVHSFHVSRLEVRTGRNLGVALDGEVCARLPATFAVAGEALRVVTPQEFEDVDDPGPTSLSAQSAGGPGRAS
jgi:diacylglycerol kinase family enzyme